MNFVSALLALVTNSSLHRWFAATDRPLCTRLAWKIIILAEAIRSDFVCYSQLFAMTRSEEESPWKLILQQRFSQKCAATAFSWEFCTKQRPDFVVYLCIAGSNATQPDFFCICAKKDANHQYSNKNRGKTYNMTRRLGASKHPKNTFAAYFSQKSRAKKTMVFKFRRNLVKSTIEEKKNEIHLFFLDSFALFGFFASFAFFCSRFCRRTAQAVSSLLRSPST